MNRQRMRRQAGYNLVEVLIAMALLGTVLISIVTLFFMGRANVYSGKQMTRAVAVGTMVMEDLSSMTQSDLVTFFGLAAAPLATQTVLGKDYPASAKLTTTPLSADPNGYLAKWKGKLGSDQFANGRLTMIATPLNQNAASTVPLASVIRVRIIIEWNESQRARHLILDTVKVDRGN